MCLVQITSDPILMLGYNLFISLCIYVWLRYQVTLQGVPKKMRLSFCLISRQPSIRFSNCFFLLKTVIHTILLNHSKLNAFLLCWHLIQPLTKKGDLFQYAMLNCHNKIYLWVVTYFPNISTCLQPFNINSDIEG